MYFVYYVLTVVRVCVTVIKKLISYTTHFFLYYHLIIFFSSHASSADDIDVCFALVGNIVILLFYSMP